MYELEELLSENRITFPMKQRGFLKQVRLGEIPYTALQDDLYSLMQRVTSMSSDLPESGDAAFWDEWILKTYRAQL